VLCHPARASGVPAMNPIGSVSIKGTA
jgi:hypothetical protein